jgi:UDP-N-acetylmuramoyl-L-alanyl-D-glutamate--2,6-diaminopimelate ligase
MLQEIIKILKEYKIYDIIDNSKQVNENSAFFCNTRAKEKGFDLDAINNGCNVVIIVTGHFKIKQGYELCYILLPDWSTYINLLKEFYSIADIKKIAVTGTNGKTSTVHFGASLSSFIGGKSSTIGTNGVCVYEHGQVIHETKTGLTTPTCTENYRILSNLVKQGVKNVFMEVSSIGIEQGRVDGIEFDVACFTNLTQDHLDYHHTMEEYFRQKLRLFSEFLKPNGVAVLNEKSGYSHKIASSISNQKIFYGNELFRQTFKGFTVEVDNKEVDFYAHGKFQVLNLFCAVNALVSLGFELPEIGKYIPKLKAPSGRMQGYNVNGVNVIIDYAHTPDALENVLQNIDGYKIVVFGCGGNRDTTKRPIMGKIASQLADFVIITNDNPRNEDPQIIAEEIAKACELGRYEIILDREQAILKAIKICNKGGNVIIAGKGNEDYQIIGDEKIPFSDAKVVEELINGADRGT